MKAYILFCPLLLLILTACQADYSQEALADARVFTMEKTKRLPEVTRDYIRYTTPKVQIETIFEHQPVTRTEYAHLPRNIDYKPIQDAQKDFLAINFVWNPPELGYTVITLGTGLRNYQFWEPLKVVLKKNCAQDAAYQSALTQAVSYVVNNMHATLSAREENRVRFSEAEVYPTHFPTDFLFEYKETSGGPDAWKDFIASLKKKTEHHQFSLVWKKDDPSKRIVIIGFSSSKNSLSGWTPGSSMMISAQKLIEYTDGPEQHFQQTGTKK